MFDAPPEDIFASHKSQDKDDIFGSSVKQQLKKPEKSLDELLAVNGTEEAVGGGGKVRGERGKKRERKREGKRGCRVQTVPL